ncbi:hypothetical protein XarbCFBP8147_10500 [Xanthomonas arboricola]|nr:hypothetical protein XarbCFBP8147_10500 [Xanthomonas arboricola]
MQPRTPTIFDGPCPPTVAGPYAVRMPRKSLHGRTCGVACDGGRARTLQPSCRSNATQLTPGLRAATPVECSQTLGSLSARCPRRSRDTP